MLDHIRWNGGLPLNIYLLESPWARTRDESHQSYFVDFRVHLTT